MERRWGLAGSFYLKRERKKVCKAVEAERLKMALPKSPKTFSLSPSQLLTLLSDATVSPAGGPNLSWEQGALSPSHNHMCARLQPCLPGTVCFRFAEGEWGSYESFQGHDEDCIAPIHLLPVDKQGLWVAEGNCPESSASGHPEPSVPSSSSYLIHSSNTTPCAIASTRTHRF